MTNRLPVRKGYWRSWGVGSAIIITTLTMSSCASDKTGPVTSWQLEDGRSIGQLANDSAAIAGIIVDPADCFQCFGVMAEWLDRRSREPGTFAILLARKPDEGEARILAVAGLRFDGTVVGMPRQAATPVEFVIRGSRELYRRDRITAESTVFRKLDSMRLDDFALSLSAVPVPK